MNCTKCKNETAILINVYIDNRLQALCDSCLIKMEPKSNELVEIEEKTIEAQELIKGSENIVRNSVEPDLSEFDEEIAAMAFTPSKLVIFSKRILTDLLRQKEDILGSMTQKERLTYKLKEATNNENYSLAAELRDKLSKLYEQNQ